MKSAFGVLLFALLTAVAAEAQTAPVAVGARVRVTAASNDLHKHVTTVTDVHSDSITVGVRGSSRTLALSDIAVLEVSAGRRSRFLRDAGLGLGIGLVAGAVAGALSYEECEAEVLFDCMLAPESQSQSALAGGIVLGVVGLATGAVVGAFHRTDRWEGASLPVRASVGASRAGGVTLRLSRTF